MILQALCELAEREDLVPDPDYETKPVSWIVNLRGDGTFVSVTDRRRNLNEGTKRKPKWAGLPTPVPRMPGRTSGDYAFLLFDKAEYALGVDPLGRRDAEKLAARVGLFGERAADMAEATGDPAVRAVAAFSAAVRASFGGDRDGDDLRATFAALSEKHGWASNDLFAFRVGRDGDDVHGLPAVRTAWRAARLAERPEPGENAARCLVTGAPVAEVGKFPMLKKVPGGSTSGISLVSVNAKAFESFGLGGNDNAPVSRGAAEAAATALNRLIDPAFPDPADPGRTLPARSVRLGDTATCFWATADDRDAQGLTDELAGEFAAAGTDDEPAETEDDVREVYRSVWRGREKAIETPGAFYVLILSGQQGRAVVRDWIETTLADAVRHVARHFDDFRVARTALKKGEPASTEAPPLWRALDALVAPGRDGVLPASLAAGAMRAAFTGVPYPFGLLQRALLRERAEAGGDDWIAAARRDARAAVLRAVLNRRRRPSPADPDPPAAARFPEVPEMLNPNLDSPGYALGALLAVLERLQQAALGDVNASVVDRYFGAASAAPRAVFVRLLKNARHHAKKAGDADRPGDRALAFKLDRIVDHFCSRFEIVRKPDGKHDRYPYAVGGLPPHLDLEQQGLFVLGYHQTRHWLWMKTEDRRAWEAGFGDGELPAPFRLKEKPSADTEIPADDRADD